MFSAAGGYVGNTGYGLANNVTTALGERLLALYADWIGVTVDGAAVSSAGALTYAKQSYLGGLGLYSGYDEKVLMEAVYYGLPMYSLRQRDEGSAAAGDAGPRPVDDRRPDDGRSDLPPDVRDALRAPTTNGDEVEYLTVAGQPALRRRPVSRCFRAS